MRIEKTDTRARKWEFLKEATGEDATSKALDCAADYYLRMWGDTTAVPKGKLAELMTAAQNRGSLTPEEIAEILDTDELPVRCEVSVSVGRQ
ncbi:hypothetical protein [Halohasta litorea]|uniref:Uncharacterized protein n=1 Tax=Halohasta litorea TaxID=869891 RepID=A0ABD6D662_9EURY|nr:hypothetical protein [Halohasta litorea]